VSVCFDNEVCISKRKTLQDSLNQPLASIDPSGYSIEWKDSRELTVLFNPSPNASSYCGTITLSFLRLDSSLLVDVRHIMFITATAEILKPVQSDLCIDLSHALPVCGRNTTGSEDEIHLF